MPKKILAIDQVETSLMTIYSVRPGTAIFNCYCTVYASDEVFLQRKQTLTYPRKRMDKCVNFNGVDTDILS